MAPPAPPLPVPRNLPFHALAAGIHTSILMCDSGVGVSVAATRQNAGVFMPGAVGAAPGARKDPASTAAAAVIVTSGSFSAPSASQAFEVCAAAGTATDSTTRRCSAKALAERPITVDLQP